MKVSEERVAKNKGGEALPMRFPSINVYIAFRVDIFLVWGLSEKA